MTQTSHTQTETAKDRRLRHQYDQDVLEIKAAAWDRLMQSPGEAADALTDAWEFCQTELAKLNPVEIGDAA